ncbi:Conserved_hypothetical protein [Hexamita inflata]|uniref:Uncharacterized protein n=1 Tax=Hexamita inflata TaxID=28002 RepID=A0AA86NZY3_9EUKA|nr:Conserved hypothetical protein [Hexamita inflata]
MICVLQVLSSCLVYNTINYVIRIQQPQREAAAYIAYEIKYRDQPVAQRKYIATYLPFTQQETEVVEYGDIEYICLTPLNNIMNINQVAIVDQFDQTFLNVINQPYVLFVNASRYKCELDNGQDLYFSKKATNAPLVIYDLDPDFKIRTIDDTKCVLYSEINVSEDKGVVPIQMNTIIVPILLEHKMYDQEFMGAVACIGTTMSTCAQKILPYQYTTPNENIYISRSILIGTDFTLPAVQIEKFDSSDTSLTITTGQCTRFVAASFRTMEVPPGSGIKYRFSEKSINGRVASFKGPYICVSKIWYCPLMFVNQEDPSLKTSCEQLTVLKDEIDWTNIQSDVGNTVYDYLLTQTVSQVRTYCELTYISKDYTNMLCLFVLIMSIMYFIASCFLVEVRQLIVTRKCPKCIQIVKTMLFYSTAIAFQIISFFTFKNSVFYMLFGVIPFVMGLVYSGIKLYGVNREQNDYEAEKENSEKKMNGCAIMTQILLQYVIFIPFILISVFLNIADVLQMLQYFKMQYYQYRYDKLEVILYVSTLINSWTEKLNSGVFPYVLFAINLINQEIIRSDWFKALITKSDDVVNWRHFGIRLILTIFQYYQNFTYLIIYQSISSLSDVITNQTACIGVQLIISGTLYSLIKFRMIFQYYLYINKTLVKLFMNFIQIFSNLLVCLCSLPLMIVSFLTGKFRLVWQYIKMFVFSLMLFVYHILLLVIDPAVCLLIPIVLLIQEFTFPMNFFIQVIGIIPSEETYAKQVNELFEIRPGHLYNKLFKAAQACISGIFLGLLLSVNGNFEMSFYFITIICCGAAYFFIGFFLTNPFGRAIGKRIAAIDAPRFQLTRRDIGDSEEAMSTMADSMKDINADYEHEVEFFQKILVSFVLGGYGYIPGIGPILATFCEYLSDPGLTRSGTFEFSVAYVFKVLTFIFIILSIVTGLKTDSAGYIVFIILFGILVAIDQYDEIASMVNDPRNWEIQKGIDILIKKINWKKCFKCKKQKPATDTIQVRSEVKSRNGTISSVFIEDTPNSNVNQSILMRPVSAEQKSPRKEFHQSKLDIAADVPIDEKSTVWKTSKATDYISEVI